MRGVIKKLSTAAADRPYLAIVVMIAVVTAFGLTAAPIVRPANLDVLYLLIVFVSALNWGRRPALFCAVVSAAVFDFCFIPPYFKFTTNDLPYVVSLSGFVAVAVITSELASRARDAILSQSARLDAEAAKGKAEAAREQLEVVNRAKDAVLSRVAHELRSPVTALLGRVQLLRQAGDPERVMRSLPALERSARVMARLSGDLLESSRGRAGKLHVNLCQVRLAPIVAAAVEDCLLAAADRHIAVETAIEPGCDALADADRIEQIVTNLMSNAIKFTPPGGRIDVRLRRQGAMIELAVSDTGVGIPADFLPQVFEPFSQADDNGRHDGLGLGLAIVKSLVEAHAGEISVASAGTNRGTTFTVRLPAIAGALHAYPDMAAIEHQADAQPAAHVRHGE